jgi:hypothetical protein
LNLGVRWDYYSPPSEERNRITNFNFKDLTLDAPGQDGFGSTVGVPKRLRNWGPRFGFAYQLDPKTVVRGGLGINYNPQMMGSGGAFRNAPYTTTYTWQQTNVTLGNSFSAPIPPLVHDSQNKLARINLRRLNDL